MKILVLNSGSSSQKSNLYNIDKNPPKDPPEPEWEGKIEWDGEEADIQIRNSRGVKLKNRMTVRSRKHAIEELLQSMWTGDARVVSSASEIDVVGHRIVHGGNEYELPTIITSDVKAGIEKVAVFAPLHNRAELDGIEIIEKQIGGVMQVAVFDTAFHRHLPESATVYPGPYEWWAQGIRRYGFHGINHQYCAERAAQILGKELSALKLVTCHLGNGCSLAGIRNGRSVDTTMGFTPLEGLMMGTRSGSVDPGILTFLMRKSGVTGQQLDEVLNTKSGLLGISGVSADMRKVVAAMKNGNARAKLAFEMFVHRLHLGIGSMIAVLNGIDALVFTAGIGENSAEMRAAVCGNFAFLGLKLDAAKNAETIGEKVTDGDISVGESSVSVLVVRAQEDWAIARDCWRVKRGERESARVN